MQGKIDRVGLAIACGPGLPPSLLKISDDSRFVSGSINHRGIEVASVDAKEKIGRIGKSTSGKRGSITWVLSENSQRETRSTKTRSASPPVRFPAPPPGASNVGKPQFPPAHRYDLSERLHFRPLQPIRRRDPQFRGPEGLEAPIYILKADGGTFDIRQSVEHPVQTILSGPAASIMGILSLADCSGSDAIALDMGGTTTDIALLADGVPLLEPLGVTIEGHKTLIRGLETSRSVSAATAASAWTRGSSASDPGGKVRRRPSEDPSHADGRHDRPGTDGNRRPGQGGAAVAPIAGEMNCPVPEAARRFSRRPAGSRLGRPRHDRRDQQQARLHHP